MLWSWRGGFGDGLLWWRDRCPDIDLTSLKLFGVGRGLCLGQCSRGLCEVDGRNAVNRLSVENSSFVFVLTDCSHNFADFVGKVWTKITVTLLTTYGAQVLRRARGNGYAISISRPTKAGT